MAEKTFNGVKLLSEMSGLPEKDIQQLWDDEKANQKKLSSCPNHFFPDTKGHKPTDRLACGNCGGTLAVKFIVYYNKGVEHGKKINPSA